MTLANAIDCAVTETVSKIMKSSKPNCEKYEKLDQLYLNVLGQHPDGLAAQCLQVISDAETKVIYPNGKIEGDRS